MKGGIQEGAQSFKVGLRKLSVEALFFLLGIENIMRWQAVLEGVPRTLLRWSPRADDDGGKREFSVNQLRL